MYNENKLDKQFILLSRVTWIVAKKNIIQKNGRVPEIEGRKISDEIK